MLDGLRALELEPLGAIRGRGGRLSDRCLFLIPATAYEIIDTWHVSGLKGTRQPRHRGEGHVVIRYSDNFKGVAPGLAGEGHASPLRLPWGQVFFRGVATASIRALQGMLDIFLEYGRSRTTAVFGTKAFQSAGADDLRGGGGRPSRRDENNPAPQPALSWKALARGKMPSLSKAHPFRVLGDGGGALALLATKLFRAAGAAGEIVIRTCRSAGSSPTWPRVSTSRTNTRRSGATRRRHVGAEGFLAVMFCNEEWK